jgi:rhamnosyltransferase subunit B
VGSLGDLHPFIALGLALRELGADVVLACACEYQTKVERAGLRFRALRPSFDDMQRELGMNRAQVTRAVLARSDFLFRRVIVPSLRVAYEDMLSIVEGADMLLSSSLSIGARLAAERRSVPWIGIVLQPMMFLSAFDPPVIPQAQWLSALLLRLGPIPTGMALNVIKWGINRLLDPVRALRADIGLRPTLVRPLFDGQFSSAGAIGLYSPLLGKIRPDYPRPTSIVGFASYDSEDGAGSSLNAALREFLAAGPPPLVFTLGSLIVNSPGSFYRESAEAARILGKRAVLLVGEGASDYADLVSADVHVGAYAPHSLLFPRAAAIVHQAGIGTLAQALHSGRPHLAVPFFADQLDNAARAVRLGVARSISPHRYRAAAVSRELSSLMTDARYLADALRVREILAAEHGAALAAGIVLDRLELLLRPVQPSSDRP